MTQDYGRGNWSEIVHGTNEQGQEVTASFGQGYREGHTLLSDGHMSEQGFWEQHQHDHYGRGSSERQATQVELLCNEFAAQVLMPALLVKRAWYHLHDLETVAVHFNVLVEALATRLEKLNLIGNPRPVPRMYFRRSGLLTGLEPIPSVAA